MSEQQILVKFTKIFKTSERRRKQAREYRNKIREKKNMQAKEWRKNNPLKVKAYKLRWNLLNAEKNKLYAKRQREKDPAKTKIMKHQEYLKHIDRYTKHRREYYVKNKDKFLKDCSRWQRDNPDKRLVIMKNHLEKYGKPFKMGVHEYKWALQYWSDCVLKRDNHICQICGKIAKHAHHILYKSQYPNMALNVNNGISLCVEHHKEIHRRAN